MLPNASSSIERPVAVSVSESSPSRHFVRTKGGPLPTPCIRRSRASPRITPRMKPVFCPGTIVPAVWPLPTSTIRTPRSGASMKRSVREATGATWLAWRSATGEAAGGMCAIRTVAVSTLSLGLTVFVAQRALGNASEVVVRGEGDALVSALAGELMEEGPPTSEKLASALKAHDDAGLRYVAVIVPERERDHEAARTLAEAGKSEMGDAILRPGQSTVLGKRVRVVSLLAPPRRGQGGPSPSTLTTGPRSERGPLPPALLAVEFEPPVIEKLRADLTRIAFVAAAASAILLAFAIAWSKSARRLSAIERRAAHEQRLVALGGMSSVMAHELRNPLASLKGHAQLLAEDLEASPDAKMKAKAARVVSEAERLESLTTSLLDFVRDGPIDRTPIAPADLIALALEDLATERVHTTMTSAPKALPVDGRRLARALHNIVDNALQASPNGESVDLTVETEAGGEQVRFTVRDRGPGIAEGSLSQIFEPFVTTRVRGTGLGLAVARRIVEQHDGTLTGDNHPAGGAVFTLRIPIPIERR